MSSLSTDALRIWNAGVDAVRPERLFEQLIAVEQNQLQAEDAQGALHAIDLACVKRIWILGAGKATAAMARGLVQTLGPGLLKQHHMAGILSVPEGCEQPLGLPGAEALRLMAGRAASSNEPAAAGLQAASEALRIVEQADEDDLVIVLLSGGGSALWPAPKPPATLDHLVELTRLLSSRGASIHEMNSLRQRLSRIAGGELAQACRAKHLWTFALSDVVGDDRSVLASGPTSPPIRWQSSDHQKSAGQSIVERYQLDREASLAPVLPLLVAPALEWQPPTTHRFVMLGNLATAVDAAGLEAERLGYRQVMLCATEPEGEAADVGRHLASLAIDMRNTNDPLAPNCLISGGEPTVTLPPAGTRGLGGRNQQLALSVLKQLIDCQSTDQIAFLSGGTDGEDGPTDAAGAAIDATLAKRITEIGLDVDQYLERCDAYSFFEQAAGLLKTGLTETNVGDLRVVTIGN